MTTLIDAFLARAAEHGERLAIVEPGGRAISYSQLARAMDAYAARLRGAGVGAGERVLVTTRIGLPLYVALAAVWRIGASAVFPEPALGLAGLRHAARMAAPKAWIAPASWRAVGWLFAETRAIPLRLSPPSPTLRQTPRFAPAQTSADAEALVSFTSGSTGAPKGISRSHDFLLAQAAALAPLLRPAPEGEVDLVGFPVFVIAGLGLGTTSVLPCWRPTRPDKADPTAVKALCARFGVTRMLVQPSVCAAMAQAGFPASVRTVMTGGGPVFPDLLARVGAGMRRMVAVYGSTEAEPIAHVEMSEISTADMEAMRSGAGILAGRPAPGTRVRIENDEILVAGRHVNQGYLDPSRNAATKTRDAEGTLWHRTGDAGRLDRDGRLWLLGRLEGVVGGLYPFCVESAARLWPGVAQAALCAVEGRPILAIAGDASQADAWRATALAAFQLPIKVLARIPLDRRHASKIDYPKLRAMLAQER